MVFWGARTLRACDRSSFFRPASSHSSQPLAARTALQGSPRAAPVAPRRAAARADRAARRPAAEPAARRAAEPLRILRAGTRASTASPTPATPPLSTAASIPSTTTAAASRRGESCTARPCRAAVRLHRETRAAASRRLRLRRAAPRPSLRSARRRTGWSASAASDRIDVTGATAGHGHRHGKRATPLRGAPAAPSSRDAYDSAPY